MTIRSIALVTAALLLAAAGTHADPQYGKELLSYPNPINTEAGGFEDLAVPFSYGTDDWSAYVIPSIAFQAYSTGLGATHWADDFIGAQAADTHRFFTAPVHLPTGARVHGVMRYTYDNSSTGHVRLFLFSTSCPIDAGCTDTTHFDFQTSASGTPGYQAGTWVAFPSSFTWLNFDGTVAYFMYARVYFSEGTQHLRSGPLVIWYKRQVSPAPASATFNDVSTGHWAFQHIEALVASGVTAGCGGGNYCPDATLTRAQMAVFLAKALGLHWSDAT